MASEKHWVDDDHYRVVSDDGSRSWLYEADGGLLAPDTCVEVAIHSDDGTTDAYEPPSVWDTFFNDGHGSHK